jgi:hypothetical protein
MNKLILIFLIGFFFLDFSFFPACFNAFLIWPYFTFSLLVLIFLFGDSRMQQVFFGGAIILILKVLLPLNIFSYIIIIGIIWLVIYFLKIVFFSQNLNIWKTNLTYLLSFVMFEILFFIGQNIEGRVKEVEFFNPQDISWKIFLLRLFIGVIFFNLVFKLWPEKESNTLALK